MNIVTMHSNEADQARWAGVWDTHRWGLIGNQELTRCCQQGHTDPAAAIDHAAHLEATRLTWLVQQLPSDTWGRVVLDAHQAAS